MRLPLLLSLLLSSWSASAGVKVAAPGLTSTGVEPRIAAFFSEHLAQQLAHRGLGVTTAAEISTLLGLERQKQLLGCADCQVELGNALGVQAMVLGTLTRSGSGYELKVRISDLEGGALAEGSRTAPDEERLLPAVTSLAGELATRLMGPGAARSVGSQAIFEDRLNVLTVGPILFAVGFYGLEYERVLTDLFSVFVAPQWLNATFARGFEVTGGARVYLFGEAPRGLYVGAYAVGGAGEDGPGFGLGGELGIQWLLGDRVAVALGYGHGWRAVEGYLSHQGTFPQVNRVRVQLGVAF